MSFISHSIYDSEQVYLCYFFNLFWTDSSKYVKVKNMNTSITAPWPH